MNMAYEESKDVIKFDLPKTCTIIYLWSLEIKLLYLYSWIIVHLTVQTDFSTNYFLQITHFATHF